MSNQPAPIQEPMYKDSTNPLSMLWTLWFNKLLTGVTTDTTLTGDGTANNPLSVIGGGTGNIDGGVPNSVYLSSQVIDGGTP